METVVKRLAITGKKVTTILKAKGEGENVLKRMAMRPKGLNPGRIYRWLHPLPIEVLLYMMTKTARDKTRQAISLYITKLRSVKVSVTGKDLAEMGYEPGPQYRVILEKVMDAKLNGLVSDLDTEKEWIARNFPAREGLTGSH